jgi:hypothetical protein
MVHHMMISMTTTSPNVDTFKTWCTQRHQTCEIIPGRRISSLLEAKPWLTSYGYYIMNNWRESSCHFDTTGPVGCFLAHRDAWAKCVSRNEHMWIFEEGVYGYDTTMFDQLDRLHPTVDLIMGHTIILPRMWRQRSVDKHAIGTLLTSIDKIYFGTKCYRLSPALAERLLQNSMTFDTHVDTFICTEAILYADEFTSCRTYKNIVFAASGGTINHSVDHSLLILLSMFVGIVLGSVCMIYILRLYRRCRSRCAAQ